MNKKAMKCLGCFGTSMTLEFLDNPRGHRFVCNNCGEVVSLTMFDKDGEKAEK